MNILLIIFVIILIVINIDILPVVIIFWKSYHKYPNIEKRRVCKCGSLTHDRTNSIKCSLNKRYRNEESTQSPAKRAKTTTLTDEIYTNSNVISTNSFQLTPKQTTPYRIINSNRSIINLTSTFSPSIINVPVVTPNTTTPYRIINTNPTNFNINSPISTSRSTPLRMINKNLNRLNFNSPLSSPLQSQPEEISTEPVIITQISSDPVILEKETTAISKRCKCGSMTHKKTNHSSCPLNKRHTKTNEDRSHLKKQYREKVKKNIITDYFEIARQTNFQVEDVFGQYVQILKDKPYYGRHLMPKRTFQCTFCEAYMWIEENSLGTLKKLLFQLCCCKGMII